MNNIIYKNKIQTFNRKKIDNIYSYIYEYNDIDEKEKKYEYYITNLFNNIYEKMKKFNIFLKKEKNKKIIYLILFLLFIIFLINSYENEFNYKINMIGGADTEMSGDNNQSKEIKNEKKEMKKKLKEQKKKFKKEMRDRTYGNRDKQENLIRDNKGNVVRRGFIKKQYYRISRILYLLLIIILIFIIPFLPLLVYVVFFYKVIINLTQYIFSK